MTVLDIRFNDLAAAALGPSDALPLDRLAPGQREMIAKAAPVPVRCVVGANSTNGTFRFHRARPGESWLHDDLDAYRMEKLITVDRGPATLGGTPW
ncbi:hypothetical protein [Amycolatopsis keratiniphila]|uniref:Uncharacterized protein n=1 Tax=Amycolatopsis keratiniphila subsp. keratiniphila TaxID=227715 RepID=A0A1W2M0L1_9PSEU|nr:hypothetical protein [Amycolatopsis keratiniphila]ONF73398.1 hypothetical protein AVR91_0204435 [Amycolatopsis keratiniphila subsp. keratiniphila]